MGNRWWKKRDQPQPEETVADADNDTPVVDWQILIDLAHDLSGGDDTVATRMSLAANDVAEFVRVFTSEEPSHGDVFTFGFDADGEFAPLQCFAAVMDASGHLTGIDWKFPLSDILFIFNNDAKHLGLVELTDQETAAFARLTPKDERQTDLFFHDVASKLDQACIARDRRLLCWDDGSDQYGYAIVNQRCFDKWVDTTIHEYHKLYDPERYA